MADKKYLEFDIWLLQSVMLANIDGRGTPERITTASDLLSKTPMAYTDLRAGLIRLAENGFIEDRDGGYAPIARVAAAARWSEREKVKQLLTAEPAPEAAKPAANLAKIADQTRDRFQKTTGVYVKRFQGFLSGLTNPKKE
jgi:hypothetical protein